MTEMDSFFLYCSEKAAKFCEICETVFDRCYYIGQIYGGDFAVFCTLELYIL